VRERGPYIGHANSAARCSCTLAERVSDTYIYIYRERERRRERDRQPGQGRARLHELSGALQLHARGEGELYI